MLTIRTTGVEDYLDGSANIKALIIGGPGAGKTRTSSFWPKPIYLDCENGRGSLADRAMPYAEIKSSKDMLDALDYLKSLERTAKVSRQFQTVVLDTVDSFQRIVKDEWVQQTRAAAFTGFDAWGYLDTKMQLLFTRLLNLDYNVVALSHYTDKSYKDGDNTIRELKLQLQGQISDQIFNDFGLVGWLGTYWAAEDGERVQKRGLTFQPTPDKPFLKDRFNATPKWMEIDFTDNDYQQIFEAFFNRPEFEELGESAVVGEIPDAVTEVARPTEGGPLAPKGVEARAPQATSPVDLATVPLDKQTKEQLTETARRLGISVRGNTLKAEIITSIEAARAAATGTAPPVPTTSPDGPSADDKPASAGASTASVEPSAPTPDAPAPASASPSPTSAPPTEDPWTPNDAVTTVATTLGGEVISEEPADAPSTPQTATPSATPSATSAPQGPSACADCGADLSADWADPTKKNVMRLSFVKHRRYLCTTCYAQA